MIRLSEAPIDPDEVVAAVTSPGAGAVVTFDGCVRDHSEGRSVRYLEYEAHDSMALAQLEALREEALRRWGLEDVAIVHRVGRLEIGESSVFIAVSAAHRRPAFEACRFLIDTLKERVPIWKKEHFEDGSLWVEGERSHRQER